MQTILGSCFTILLWAIGAYAGPISTTASADLTIDTIDPTTLTWVRTYDVHSTEHGTTSAAVDVAPTPNFIASASASATGLTFEASSTSFYYYRYGPYEGTITGAAEVNLEETFTIPLPYWRMEMVWSIDDAQGVGQAGIMIDHSSVAWTYDGSLAPATVTAGPFYCGDFACGNVAIRVWARSESTGSLYMGHGDIRATLQNIRVYDEFGQITGSGYTTASGMQYPVEGGTYIPEPGTGTLLLGGIALIAARVLRRR